MQNAHAQMPKLRALPRQLGARRLQAGRLTTIFFLFAGLLQVAQLNLPGYDPTSLTVMEGLGVGSIAIGGLAWVLPWERLPWVATLGGPFVALAMIGVGLAYGAAEPGESAIATLYLMLVFVWLAVIHRPPVIFGFAPVALAAAVVFYLPDTSAAARSAATAALVVPVVAGVGAMLSGAIQRSHDARALAEQRLNAMETLAAAPHALLTATSDTETAERVGALALEVIGGRSAAVLLRGEDGGFAPAGHSGVVDPLTFARLTEDPEVSEAVLSGRPQMVRAYGAPLLVLPLRGRGQLAGAVVVTGASQGTVERISPDVIGLLARQVGLPLDERYHRQRLVDQASRDHLTGLGNRSQADALLTDLVPGDAVALLDIDNFKQVNDTRGHDAGDAILVELADYLRSTTRSPDSVARYGGEEFLLVFFGGGLDAEAIAGRLLAGWRERRPEVTFSIGIAAHTAAREAAATLTRADNALYAAKHAGRDTAVVDTDAGPSVSAGAPSASCEAERDEAGGSAA